LTRIAPVDVAMATIEQKHGNNWTKTNSESLRSSRKENCKDKTYIALLQIKD